MATGQAPHLLTVPREIRDRIYSHLQHVVKMSSISPVGYAVVQLDIALHTGLLLTHSQLHDEYLHANYFTKLCVIAATNLVVPDAPGRQMLKPNIADIAALSRCNIYMTLLT